MRNRILRNRIHRMLLGSLAVLLALPGLAQAQSSFDRGTVRFSGSISSSNSFGDSYTQLGIGAGYYLADGLELGLDARYWSGGSQDIYELEPSLTYVLTNFGAFKPYAGVLYRKTFLEHQDDLSAYGGRAGISVSQSQNLVIRAGVVGIHYSDCASAGESDCSEFYPEISAGFYF